MKSNRNPATDSVSHPLTLTEAQSRAVKFSAWEDLENAFDALKPLRAEWYRESPYFFSGVAYLAGLTAGKRIERHRRKRQRDNQPEV